MDNDLLIQQIKADSQTSYDFQSRRYPQWDENYTLYRDKVTTNRLTQRQAVNLPIVRETVQTWIAKIDEPPLLSYKAKGQSIEDKKAELVINEVYKFYYDYLKMEQLDNLEKKIVGLQGRVFKKIGYDRETNRMWTDIIDPFDIEIDPKCNIFDIDNTALFLNHKNIFEPLRDVLANPAYDESEKQKLKQYLDSREGILKAEDSAEQRDTRNKRLEALGVSNFDAFGARDTVVQIKECYKKIWDTKESKFIWYLVKIAVGEYVLLKKPLREAIGVDFLPFVTWADDPDINDIWSDGKADSVRTFNKIANVYVSQMLENRTYRNFGMFFYDNTNQKFTPSAVDPKPFGMYGIPGDPSKIMKQMDIPQLNGTIEELSILKEMIQSSVAITPNEQGLSDKGQDTLGEVKLNMAQSKGRLAVTAKNYRMAWKEFGYKFYEILNANAVNGIELFKKGVDNEYYPKTIYPVNWRTSKGFDIEVVLKSEKDMENQEAIQKAQFVMSQFQNNPVAIKIAKKKLLESLGWRPDEIKQVEDSEQQMTDMASGKIGALSGIDEVAKPIQPLTPELLPANK